MNDLFHASNRTLSTKFLDLNIEIRQIQVKELDEISIVAQPIKAILNNSLDDESIDTAIKAHLLEVFGLVSRLCNIPHEIVTKHYLESPSDIEGLFKLVLHINSAYFIDEEKPKQHNKKDTDSTWFDSFQFLISQGHQHSEIMNMAYGAFKAYLKAAQRSYAKDLSVSANIVRMAHHADKNAYSKFIADLKM